MDSKEENKVNNSLTPKEIKYNYNIWITRFKYTKNFHSLRITDIGMYSITKPNVSNKIVDIIYQKNKILNKKNLYITETHAGIGGISYYLLENFKYINLIEKNDLHYNILINNINVYNLNSNKTCIYNCNYLKIYKTLYQDIIISDPPWGGPNYKYMSDMSLYIENINIIKIINELFKLNKFKIFIFLAMKNYNFNDLKYLNKLLKYEIIYYSNIYIIIIDIK